MTVSLYYRVWRIIGNEPKTAIEITNELFKDLKYECDRKVQKQNVNEALKQLKDEGKIASEKIFRNDKFVPAYYLNDGRQPSRIQSKGELILSKMEDGVWYKTKDITGMVYDCKDKAASQVYCDRIARVLKRLESKNYVIHKKSEIANEYGVHVNLWRSIL